jgi:hypothetical protein
VAIRILQIKQHVELGTDYGQTEPQPNTDNQQLVATQVRSRMATKYGRSNGSFHRVLASSAGGPGFDSRLRHNTLRCSMQKDVDGSGQPST